MGRKVEVAKGLMLEPKVNYFSSMYKTNVSENRFEFVSVVLICFLLIQFSSLGTIVVLLLYFVA